MNYIFCLWADTIEKLKDFLDFLNAFHPSIKFTMEYSPYQINYLDVLITKDESGETVRASLYMKPTDSHHAVYKKSIPYSQAVRMKRICSEEADLQHKLGDLESLLANRGYRTESARREIQTVNSIERQVLLEKCPKIQGDSVTLVLAFHLAFYIIFEILKSTHRIIENPQKLKTILPKPSRVAFHNPKTLRDTLVCSKLRPDYEEERAVFICGRKNCDICNILEPGNEFKSTTTEKLFKINFHFHCNNECVVFLLTYKICRKQYVGSAITKFNKMPN